MSVNEWRHQSLVRPLTLLPFAVHLACARSHFPGRKDLTLLTRQDCRAYAEDSHRKDGELKAAYKIGANPDEWLEETDRIVREAEQARDQEELEAQENEDQLQDEQGDDDAEDSASSPAKKRAANDDGAKPASKSKKAKTTTSTKKEPTAATAPRKSAPIADDEAGDVSTGDSDDAMKKVRNWRHAIQRAFLPKDRAPTAQDVEQQGGLFTTVENAEITAEQLRETKINKVMRKIIALDTIPLDETHHFRERAEALVHKWNHVLNAASHSEGTGGSSLSGMSSLSARSDTNLDNVVVVMVEDPPSSSQPNGGSNDGGDASQSAAATNGNSGSGSGAGVNGGGVGGSSTAAAAAAAPQGSSREELAGGARDAAAGDETVGDLTEIKDGGDGSEAVNGEE